MSQTSEAFIDQVPADFRTMATAEGREFWSDFCKRLVEDQREAAWDTCRDDVTDRVCAALGMGG